MNSGPSLRPSRVELSALWQVNNSCLELYHEIATGQAARSFRNAQIAAALGFVALLTFALIAVNASSDAGKLVVGGLGAVAAGMAAYVSRTFIRSQEVSAGHLRSYFDQPLEYSRYLLAERLVTDSGLSEGARAEVIGSLAQTIAAGPQQPPPPGNLGGDGFGSTAQAPQEFPGQQGGPDRARQ